MNDSPLNELAQIGVRLIDDAYMAWAAAEADSGNALTAWFEDGSPRAGTAFYVYLAALDREQAAARDLERLAALAEPFTAECAREQQARAQ